MKCYIAVLWVYIVCCLGLVLAQDYGDYGDPDSTTSSTDLTTDVDGKDVNQDPEWYHAEELPEVGCCY